MLQNAVIAWNLIQVAKLVEPSRGEGHVIHDAALARTRHLNRFGRYDSDLEPMRQTSASPDRAHNQTRRNA